MSSKLKSKSLLILLLVLSLPILLHVYDVSMELGSFGMILGLIGMTVSPFILFGNLIYMILQAGK